MEGTSAKGPITKSVNARAEGKAAIVSQGLP